jgi:histidinol-phosphate/aromatic aminotransferase/cobyric acid decarboxylase-like protein
VIKSISKSYGVPGLRLGVLASGDTKLIGSVKKDVSIWNINSFAEFYLQIESKYAGDYSKAMDEFRKERSRYVSELRKIKGLRVIPSQANYVMAEVLKGKARELVKKLLVKYDIFIKDLTKKAGGEYVRLAVRNTEDNDKLLNALKKELS